MPEPLEDCYNQLQTLITTEIKNSKNLKEAINRINTNPKILELKSRVRNGFQEIARRIYRKYHKKPIPVYISTKKYKTRTFGMYFFSKLSGKGRGITIFIFHSPKFIKWEEKPKLLYVRPYNDVLETLAHELTHHLGYTYHNKQFFKKKNEIYKEVKQIEKEIFV